MNEPENYQYFRNYFTHTECILTEKYIKSINLKPYPVTLNGKREKISVVPTTKYIPTSQISTKEITIEPENTCSVQTIKLSSRTAEDASKQAALKSHLCDIQINQQQEEVCFVKNTDNVQTLKGSETNISKKELSDVEEMPNTKNVKKHINKICVPIGALALFLSIRWIFK